LCWREENSMDFEMGLSVTKKWMSSREGNSILFNWVSLLK
jgi:hypothetical protein